MNVIIALAIIAVSMMIVFSDEFAAIGLLIFLKIMRKDKEHDISGDADIPISYEAFEGIDTESASAFITSLTID